MEECLILAVSRKALLWDNALKPVTASCKLWATINTVSLQLLHLVSKLKLTASV